MAGSSSSSSSSKLEDYLPKDLEYGKIELFQLGSAPDLNYAIDIVAGKSVVAQLLKKGRESTLDELPVVAGEKGRLKKQEIQQEAFNLILKSVDAEQIRKYLRGKAEFDQIEKDSDPLKLFWLFVDTGTKLANGRGLDRLLTLELAGRQQQSDESASEFVAKNRNVFATLQKLKKDKPLDEKFFVDLTIQNLNIDLRTRISESISTASLQSNFDDKADKAPQTFENLQYYLDSVEFQEAELRKSAGAGQANGGRRKVADTGASEHLCRENPHLLYVQPLRTERHIHGIGGALTCKAEGYDPKLGAWVTIVEDGLDQDLISVGKLLRTHTMTVEGRDTLVFTPKYNGAQHFYAQPAKDNLFTLHEGKLDDLQKVAHAYIARSMVKENVWTLHRMVGHISEKDLITAVENGEFARLNLTRDDIKAAKLSECIACSRAKIRRGHYHALTAKLEKGESDPNEEEENPVEEQENPAAKEDELSSEERDVQIGSHLHCDIMYVKYNITQVIYLFAVEQVTGHLWLKRLTGKDFRAVGTALGDLVNKHREWQRLRGEKEAPEMHIHTDPESTMMKLQDDRDMKQKGITITSVAPDVHEKTAERYTQTVKRKLCAVLLDLGYTLPSELLPYALEDTVLGLNQTPNSRSGKKTPTYAVTGKKVDGGVFQVPFGCVGVFHDPYAKGIEPRGELGIVIGREADTRRLQVFWLQKKGDFTTFRDKVRPIAQPLPDYVVQLIGKGKYSANIHNPIELETPHRRDVPVLTEPEKLGTSPDRASVAPPHEPAGQTIPASLHRDSMPNASSTTHRTSRVTGTPVTPMSTISSSMTAAAEGGGRTGVGSAGDGAGAATGTQAQTKRVKLDPEVAEAGAPMEGVPQPPVAAEGVEVEARSEAEITVETSGLLATRAFVAKLMAATTADEEREAINKELGQMVTQKAFSPVDKAELVADKIRKAVNSVMLLTDKFAPDGTFLKVKARLVIKGYQDKATDVKTDSPTVRPEVVMLALNIAASKDYDIDVFDVGGAFLEAPLKRDDLLVRLDKGLAKQIIKRQPELDAGLLEDGSLLVKLNKAVYGLRESPRAWYETLSSKLIEAGWKRSKRDPCLFLKEEAGEFHYALVHVDDILSVGPAKLMNELRVLLNQKFAKVTENINPIDFNYLGMALTRDRRTKKIELRQGKYIDDIAKRLNLNPTDTSSTPATATLFDDVEKDNYLEPSLTKLFVSIVMTMLYLTKTRPDIKCAVAYLTTRLQHPLRSDWIKMIRVAKYLNGTRDVPMVITDSDMTMVASADASFAVHRDRKSHSGVLVWVGTQNAPVTASSSKQKLTTKSSTEAELVALNQAVETVVFLREILHEMGFKQGAPTLIEQDNKSCILMANRGAGGAKSRSVDIKLFWVSEQIQNLDVRLQYTKTDHVLADGLTKPFVGQAFELWRDRILNLKTDDWTEADFAILAPATTAARRRSA